MSPILRMWKSIAVITKIDVEFSTVTIISMSPETEKVVRLQQMSVCMHFSVVVVNMREPKLAQKLLDCFVDISIKSVL